MDIEVLEAMVKIYQAELYRYVRYLGADAATADEVIQDVFLAVYNSPSVPDIEDEQRCAAWLRGITRNTFLNYCRSHRRRMKHEIADPLILAEAEKFWITEFLPHDKGFDYIEALRRCIEKLPRKNKELILAFYGKTIPRSALAKCYGMTKNGLKSRLRRIRAVLAKCVQLAVKASENYG